MELHFFLFCQLPFYILVNAFSAPKNKDILFEESVFAPLSLGFTYETIQEVNSVGWTIDQWSSFNTTFEN